MNNDCINALNLMYECTLILSFELLLSVVTKAGCDKLPSKLHNIKKQWWAAAAAAAEEIHVRYAVAAVAAAAAAVAAVAALLQNQEACLILFSIPEWLWQDFS